MFLCDNTNMEIRCIVQRIIFTDSSTGYAVLSCRSEKEEVVITGKMALLRTGEKISAQGEWTDHPKYGRQFRAYSYTVLQGYDHAVLFERLSRSKFRSRFRLSLKDRQYISEKTLPVIEKHADEIIRSRLAPAYIENDGKQTPIKGHPVFIAQHACACCCRGCLEKWHGITKGHELSETEQAYVKSVIMTWIESQITE